MKKEMEAVNQPNVEEVVDTVHPLKKNYMIVSTKTVDYDNLTAFEAVSMSLVFVLSITAGTLISLVSLA
jgi:hypothetical protein